MLKILPIEQIKAQFLQALISHDTLLLTAEPGAGKSTCLPLWLLTMPELAGQKIYLLQPRRLAAKNVACFLAKQLGEPVGQSIGYRLKNENKVSANTRLEVITEGILTQIIQNDAELDGVGLIILDEFHERSLNGDLAFALSRDVQQSLREDLKILLMSATLACNALLKQLPDAVSLSCKGRSYPVEVSYQPPLSTKLWREHCVKVIKEVLNNHQGSILVFLPGSGDIRYLTEQLQAIMPANFLLCPLYGELSIVQQQQAILPAEQGFHKLVLSTNIAETSLTIEGVNMVIDSGLEKVAIYDQQILTNRLLQRNIAKASAIQRAGRAGRLMAGHCLRLYSQEDFSRRPEQSDSEIQQTDLLPLLLEAARWGVNQLNDLPLLEKPAQVKERQGWQELISLNLVDEENRLNRHGKQVSSFSCHPRFAHMIVKAKALENLHHVKQLTALACLMSAVLEERDIFRGEQARNNCDLSYRLSILLSQRSSLQGSPKGNNSKNPLFTRIFKQAAKLAQQINCKIIDSLPLNYTGLLLALAYPERLAKARTTHGEFIAFNGKGLTVVTQDSLAAEEFVVAAQLSQYKQCLQVRIAAAVDVQLLIQWQLITPQTKQLLNYDKQQDRITCKEQLTVGAIVLKEQRVNNQLNKEQCANLWSAQIQKNGLSWLNWQAKDTALLTRWRWVNQTQQHLAFPEVSEHALLTSLNQWFVPFIDGIKSKAQLNKLDLSIMLLSLLNYQQQQQLNVLAPTHFSGPTGRRCPIRYSDMQDPIVSLPMQEIYGLEVTPCIGDEASGKSAIPLLLELLSPAKRPIQLTQDLAGFWQGSYRQVQKEMKAKYPKHFWPDDPAHSAATNKIKKYIK